MIVYPNAKINIGLSVTDKREDGFHNLETVFYPITLSDILEINEVQDMEKGACFFENTGISVDCPADKNLVIKAYHLLCRDYSLPAVRVHLHKIIPFGAGLGGGSSDAAFMLKALNVYFHLNIGEEQLIAYAATLGSDCAFFIKNSPVFAHGKGEVMEDITLSLDDYVLVLVKPSFGMSTAEAYSGIRPRPAAYDLRKLGALPLVKWREYVVNDFEENVTSLHPQIEQIKQQLYAYGAVYAAMTGSGSAVFALFESKDFTVPAFADCFVWQAQ